MNLIEKYNKSLQDIYDHVGFKEDWVVCPIDDRTEMIWQLINKYPDIGDYHSEKEGSWVKYAETIEKFYSDGDYYVDEIYTQRFYNKWIYRGEKYTMIFCDPHVDGMKYFAIYDNSKEETIEEKRDRTIKNVIE